MLPYVNFELIDKVIKNKNIYGDFREKLNNTYAQYVNEVKTNKYTSDANKQKQKYRVMYDYMFPLSYLIYGYIYEEYNKKQIERHLFSKNDKIYNMYNFFFDKHNPIIKKVNLYYYYRFLKDKERINKGEEGGIFLQNDIVEEKKKMNAFFNNFLKNFIKSETNIDTKYYLSNALNDEYNELYKNIITCISYINNINAKLNNINKGLPVTAIINYNEYTKNMIKLGLINKGTPTLTSNDFILINGIISKIKDVDETNDKDLIDIINYLGGIKEYKIFKIYESEYNVLYNLIYSKVLDNLKNINNFIILLNKIDNDNTPKLILNQTNINALNIIKNKNIINIFFNNISGKRVKQSKIIELINQIGKNLNVEIELYEDYFKSFGSENNSNKKNLNKKLLKEIIKQYTNDLNNIYDLLKELNDYTFLNGNKPSFLNTAIHNMSSSSNKDTDQFKKNLLRIHQINTNENNCYLLIQLFLMAFSIYERLEDSYFINLSNVNDEILKTTLKSTNVDYKAINNLLTTFVLKYRDYKKHNSLEKENNIKILDVIDEDLNKYVSNIGSDITSFKTNNSNKSINKQKINSEKKKINESLAIIDGNGGSISNVKTLSIKKFMSEYYNEFEKFNTNFQQDINKNHDKIYEKIKTKLTSLSKLDDFPLPVPYTYNTFESYYISLKSIGIAALGIPALNTIILDAMEQNTKNQYKNIAKNLNKGLSSNILDLTSNSTIIFEKINTIYEYLVSIKNILEKKESELKNKSSKIDFELSKISRIISSKENKIKLYQKMKDNFTLNITVLNNWKNELLENKELLITPQKISIIKITNKISLDTISRGETKKLNLSQKINSKNILSSSSLISTTSTTSTPLKKEGTQPKDIKPNTKTNTKSNTKTNIQSDVSTETLPNKQTTYIYYTINEIKENFINSFEVLFNTSKVLDDGINKLKESKSPNKLSFLYSTKNKKLNDILNESIFKLKDSYSLEYDKINDKFNEIIKKLNNSFKTNSNDFIKLLNVTPTNKNDNNIKKVSNDIQPFFTTFNNYNNKLIKNIKVLLEKINSGEYTLREDVINNQLITTFNNNIIKNKKEKYENIKIEGDNTQLKNEKKGDITYVLSYTDVMFGYFIELLIFIDFLTFFYVSN